MQRTVIFNELDDTIELTVAGIMTDFEMFRTMGAIVSLAIQHHCFHWIIDFSKVVFNITPKEIESSAELAAKLNSQLGEDYNKIYLAIMANKGNRSDPVLQDMLKGADQHVKVFTDMDEARKWILTSNNLDISVG